MRYRWEDVEADRNVIRWDADVKTLDAIQLKYRTVQHHGYVTNGLVLGVRMIDELYLMYEIEVLGKKKEEVVLPKMVFWVEGLPF